RSPAGRRCSKRPPPRGTRRRPRPRGSPASGSKPGARRLDGEAEGLGLENACAATEEGRRIEAVRTLRSFALSVAVAGLATIVAAAPGEVPLDATLAGN